MSIQKIIVVWDSNNGEFEDKYKQENLKDKKVQYFETCGISECIANKNYKEFENVFKTFCTKISD
jgi:hypothetical protein